jgi:LPXTG-site transpeptidase (sortase) family protein
MRRGPFLLIAVGALAAVAGVASLAFMDRPLAHVALPSVSATAIPARSDKHAVAVATPSATAAPAPATATASSNATGTAAAARPAAMATISIPRIGIHNAPIYDRGLDSRGEMLIAPGYAVTHYAFSAPFGGGNAVIYGHDDIQGNIFGHLYDLGPGDLIQIIVGGQAQSYRVTGHQIVAPTSVGILNPTGDVRLTIMTCWPFNVDTKRWIVTAVRV